MATEVINTRYEILEPAATADSVPFIISKARDRIEGRVVRLQVLPSTAPEVTTQMRPAFHAAAQNALRLDNTNILRLYDEGETESGDLYVAGEYLRGITLQERIRRIAPFSLTVATDIAIAIAEALDVAHRQGIMHGDLRPAQVLLSPEGQIKVQNFAFGRIADPGADRAAYTAPEYGQDKPLSTAVDIYGLGASLFEMLAGKPPAAAGTARTPSLREINPGVPPALEGIAQKAMHPDLETRYRSASALLNDLQAVRDALRAGRSLAWSPLAQKRAPRPSADATTIAPRPAGVIPTAEPGNAATSSAGTLSTAAREIDEERYRMPEREPSRALSITLRILFVLTVLGVVALTWYGAKLLEAPSDVLIPNLIGHTFDDAKRIAQQQNFTLSESPNSTYSDAMPEDQIYQQDPLPGHFIKAGKEVMVYRSLGPRLLVVPDLVGTTQDYATRALQDANLPSGTITEEYSDNVQAGVVIRQSPEKSSRVARNTAVNFVVSKGRQPPDVPGGLEASSSASDRADMHWDGAPRADSYTVLRSLNGDTNPIAKGLTDTHFTDTGLQPDTTYSYSVEAVNAAGASDPSDPALVTTQSPPVAGGIVLPSDTTIMPPTDNGTGTPAAPAPAKQARLRQFNVAFRVPRRPRGTRHVQIEVQDATGTNLVYDENHDPGDQINAPLQGIGNKVTFRIFLDEKLVKQRTL